MKSLQDILYGVRIKKLVGRTNHNIEGVQLDSRKVSVNHLFIAIKGELADGHDFIPKAIGNGAIVIICEIIPESQLKAITYIQVDDARKAAAVIASNFYDHPSKQLKLIGVTGTNGKTTIVTLLHQLFSQLGVVSGLLSTVENKIGDRVEPSRLTTPDVISTNQLLLQMVEEGCEVCFMEVSSHAVVQKRVHGLDFAGGIFTNISRDHLDYHKTFKEYIKAKQGFFDMLPKTAFALYNDDDKNGEIMVQNSRARKISYGMKSFSHYKVKVLEQSIDGLLLNIQGVDLYTRLSGDFNALNLLAAYAVANELEEDQLQVYEKLSAIKGAAGRFEKVISPAGVIGIVDYAHSPDSLEKTLQTIKKIRKSIESVITVVGCGGNRDKGKRPEMAEVAVKYSDRAIFTSDNPRDEHPSDIIEEMMKGVKITQKQKVLNIRDRREAIQTAVSMAKPGDIILIAGKGHEDYQEIKGERTPFSDKEELKKAYTVYQKENNK